MDSVATGSSDQPHRHHPQVTSPLFLQPAIQLPRPARKYPLAASLWRFLADPVVTIVVSLEVIAPFTSAREHLGRGSGCSTRTALTLRVAETRRLCWDCQLTGVGVGQAEE